MRQHGSENASLQVPRLGYRRRVSQRQGCSEHLKMRAALLRSARSLRWGAMPCGDARSAAAAHPPPCAVLVSRAVPLCGHHAGCHRRVRACGLHSGAGSMSTSLRHPVRWSHHEHLGGQLTLHAAGQDVGLHSSSVHAARPVHVIGGPFRRQCRRRCHDGEGVETTIERLQQAERRCFSCW